MYGTVSVTTGEAVTMEVTPARVLTRAWATVIDVFAQVLLLVFGMVPAAIAVFDATSDTAATVATISVLTAAVVIGYPVVWETATAGATPGKLALGIRVVRDDGGPITMRHAAIRGVCAAVIDFWTLGCAGAVAAVAVTCSPQGRRIGDALAGTMVVHERRALTPTAVAPVAYPPAVAWAQHVAAHPLDDRLLAAVRAYVTRHPSLAPDARDRVGQTVVAAVQRSAGGVPAPAGIPPVTLAQTVLAVRRTLP